MRIAASTARRITGSPIRADQAVRLRQGHSSSALDQLAGNQQAPRGGIDEQRAILADMAAPVARCDLVADQRIARGHVGNAQQRFGQAHQRHAFRAAQRIFLHQRLHRARPGIGAQLRDQRAGRRCDRRLERFGHAGLRQQRRRPLGAARGRGDRRTQRRLPGKRGEEAGERLAGGRGLIHGAMVSRRVQAIGPILALEQPK
jgi:hypothetical protein